MLNVWSTRLFTAKSTINGIKCFVPVIWYKCSSLSSSFLKPSTIALCQPGCKHGECVGPNKCKCHPGFTGKTCNQGKSWPGAYRHLDTVRIKADELFLFGGKMLQLHTGCESGASCYFYKAKWLIFFLFHFEQTHWQTTMVEHNGRHIHLPRQQQQQERSMTGSLCWRHSDHLPADNRKPKVDG